MIMPNNLSRRKDIAELSNYFLKIIKIINNTRIWRKKSTVANIGPCIFTTHRRSNFRSIILQNFRAKISKSIKNNKTILLIHSSIMPYLTY